MNNLKSLTGTELRIMEIVWKKEAATVNEVLKEIIDTDESGKETAHSTILTFMRILEKKGYLAHRKRVRAFEYYPVVSQDSAKTSLLDNITKTFFRGSHEQLMMNILEHGNISKEELKKVKDLISKMEDK